MLDMNVKNAKDLAVYRIEKAITLGETIHNAFHTKDTNRELHDLIRIQLDILTTALKELKERDTGEKKESESSSSGDAPF